MIPLLLLLVFIAAFLAAAVAVVIAASLMEGRRMVLSGSRLSISQDQVPMLLQQQPMSSISFWQELLSRLDFFHHLKTRLAEAGMKWSVGRVAAAMLFCATLGVAAGAASPWFPFPVSLCAGLLAGSLPYAFVHFRRNRRFAQIEELLPDSLDALARAMRAGHPFAAAMDVVSGETSDPLGAELRRSCDEYRLGLTWLQVLDNMADRLPIVEIRLMAAAVSMQIRTGGKLTEILERLAEAIRESISLRGDLRAISAQGRLTGIILTILPIGLGFLMYFVSPDYINILLTHPFGPPMLAGAALSLILGHFVIRQIVNIKV